jgi:hypothetical protein
VTATETEFRIVLSRRVLAPGKYMFVARNRGKFAHSLAIDGPGLSHSRIAGTIAPGQSRTLTVSLRSGSFQIYCPVDGHRQRGMEVMIRVGGGTAAATTTAKATTTTTPTTTRSSGYRY